VRITGSGICTQSSFLKLVTNEEQRRAEERTKWLIGLSATARAKNTRALSQKILDGSAWPILFVCSILKPIMFHFRLNSHYIFFLLQVTEAVNLKRAETTAFRKANRLTRYTRSFLKESDKSTLQRTNQGYKQFKSMRGTAPYFEQQKLRLFSMIR